MSTLQFKARAKTTKLVMTGKDSHNRAIYSEEIGKEWHEGCYFEESTEDGVTCLILSNREGFVVDDSTLCYRCPDTEFWTNDVLRIAIDNGGDDPEKHIAKVYFDRGAFLVDCNYGEEESLLVTDLEDLDISFEIIGNTIDNPELNDYFQLPKIIK